MKLFILVAVVALALGGYFHDDIGLYFESEFSGSGSQGNSATSELGGAVRNNMGYVGGSLGQ